MKHCPCCGDPLAKVDYEGFVLWRCARCRGYLAPLYRYEAIKRLPLKSQDELKAEATADFKGDHPAPISCPHCHRSMRKQAIRLPVLALRMDVCFPCSLAWFDGGELALAQLGHEATPAFADAQEMKRRMAELEASPERKAAFEANLARLPETSDPVEEAFLEVARGVLRDIQRSSHR